MGNYGLLVVTVGILTEVISQTTENTTSNGQRPSHPYSTENSGDGTGIGSTGLIVLVAMVILTVISVVVIVIIYKKKRQQLELETRAKRSSYVNQGYEHTEGEHFIHQTASGSQKSNKGATPVKPSRRSSSKKSQNAVNYENIEIGVKQTDKTDFSSKSLPRNINEDVNLMVPNMKKGKGSSIPFIDASRETLDKISEKQSEENISKENNDS